MRVRALVTFGLLAQLAAACDGSVVAVSDGASRAETADASSLASPDTSPARDAGSSADAPVLLDAQAGELVALDAQAGDAQGLDHQLGDAQADGDACASRRGGAFVTFDVCTPAQRFTAWVTSRKFIDEAIASKGTKGRIPLFDVIDGRDCDARYAWHVDAATAAFWDVTADFCDTCPDRLDPLAYRRYCPRSARVVDVVDLR